MELHQHIQTIVAETSAISVEAFRAALARIDDALFTAFSDGTASDDLVRIRALGLDGLLTRAWSYFIEDAGQPSEHLALVAVGGYGRGTLLPHSDIDLLILYRDGYLDTAQTSLEAFVTFAWDIGLTLGHSVRTPNECFEQAHDDVSVMTNLMEARLLCGVLDLFADMREQLQPEHLWPSSTYFQTKLEEQHERYLHFDETAYKLEPNVKESPGGLRDIQTIAWVAKRHFDAETLADLEGYDFLSQRELSALQQGRSFLWRVRFALHMIAGRREDRLLFDYQIQVAKALGYSDADNNLAVEQFMQAYYQHVTALSALNDVLLQLFSEAILHQGDTTPVQPINKRFQARHGFIEARDTSVFQRKPQALLEIFNLLQTHPGLTGIRAETLRLIHRDRHLIDERFRSNVRNRRLFLDMLREPDGVTRVLQLMNRYGLLGRYLPAFGDSVGRMQYDLFHTLTVDEHSLFVLRNIRRLRLPRFDHEYPFASAIMQALDRPELLYIAALFHDVAKGRGGDHSVLGAEDVADFCRHHGLTSRDTDTICWLVRQHLLMSMTAQRKDINDPTVVHDFATEIGSRDRLDRLFVFTVCDIRATNPKLWNSWKESLLVELYNNTARTLERGLHNPLQQTELAAETRLEAIQSLRDAQTVQRTETLWGRFEDDYFLRHSATEIGWHAEAILTHEDSGHDLPLVQVRDLPDHGTTVFVYARDRDYLFGLTTGILAQLGLSILDARIATTDDGYTIDSFAITEGDGEPIQPGHRHTDIETALHQAIADPDVSSVKVTRRPSRRSQAFTVPTQVYFSDDGASGRTAMELITADRPGLLSIVGEVFRKRGILLQTAKIITVGERAEDVFFITDINSQPLADPALFRQVRRILIRALDRLQREEQSP